MNQVIDYHAILPELILSGTILLVLVVDVFLPAKRKSWSMIVGLIGTIAALIATFTLIGDGRTTFGGAYVVDNFAILFKIFFLAVAILVLGISYRYFREGGFYQGEYYFLLLTSFLGCVMMPSSRDLLLLFIALELVSAPGFLMAAFRKSDPKSNEAGLKFFLIGVLSTAVMLYGMSLIYGLTGTTRLDAIARALSNIDAAKETLAFSAILFVVIGFAFKVSAVPFQFWAPDTYEGAPVPVAAFLAVASSAAGFAGLLQLMFVAFIHQYAFWVPIFAAISIATMTLGNLVALKQTQVVRLLAYSGIAQAGYILLPFALVSGDQAVNRSAFTACVAYILIYAIMNIGAFAVSIAVSRREPALLITRLRGPGSESAAPGRRDDGVHDLAGRHPAHRWILGQDLDLPGGDRARRDRFVARRHHVGELRHQRGVLLRGAEADDLRAGARRLAHAVSRSGERGGLPRARGDRRGLRVPQPDRACSSDLDPDRLTSRNDVPRSDP